MLKEVLGFNFKERQTEVRIDIDRDAADTPKTHTERPCPMFSMWLFYKYLTKCPKIMLGLLERWGGCKAWNDNNSESSPTALNCRKPGIVGSLKRPGLT